MNNWAVYAGVFDSNLLSPDRFSWCPGKYR